MTPSPAHAAILAAQSAGAFVYLGSDGMPRMKRADNVPEDVKTALREHREEVTRLLPILARSEWLRLSVRLLGEATRKPGRTVPSALVGRWLKAAGEYASTGEGLETVRAVEREILESPTTGGLR